MAKETKKNNEEKVLNLVRDLHDSNRTEKERRIDKKRKTKVRDIFGILKEELKGVDTAKLLKEVDKELWPDDDGL